MPINAATRQLIATRIRARRDRLYSRNRFLCVRSFSVRIRSRERPANRARVTEKYQPPDPRRQRVQPDELVCADSSLEGSGFEPSVPGGDTIFCRPAGTDLPGSQNRILTIEEGRFTICGAGLAPARISTPGHRAFGRKPMPALPALRALVSGGGPLRGSRHVLPHGVRDHKFESVSFQRGVCKMQPYAWKPANCRPAPRRIKIF
jgi:hypothetical protein